MRKSCDTCYYGCKNKNSMVCSYYFTTDMEIERMMEDEMVEEIIESERRDFYSQWFEYIGEYE